MRESATDDGELSEIVAMTMRFDVTAELAVVIDPNAELAISAAHKSLGKLGGESPRTPSGADGAWTRGPLRLPRSLQNVRHGNLLTAAGRSGDSNAR